jgi:hypothetical protein
MKPSKGPWEFERPEQDAFSHDSGHTTRPVNFLIAALSDGDDWNGADYIEIHGPNQEANAALISSAPEMLEALKVFVADFECDADFDGVDASHGPKCAKCLAEAAIAKAEGKP